MFTWFIFTFVVAWCIWQIAWDQCSTCCRADRKARNCIETPAPSGAEKTSARDRSVLRDETAGVTESQADTVAAVGHAECASYAASIRTAPARCQLHRRRQKHPNKRKQGKIE